VVENARISGVCGCKHPQTPEIRAFSHPLRNDVKDFMNAVILEGGGLFKALQNYFLFRKSQLNSGSFHY
jgi:hypothetical protein